MSPPAAQGLLKAGLLDAAVKAGDVFKRKNRHHHSVQYDELQVHHVVNALHGLNDDTDHRNQHTDHDEGVKYVVQVPAELAGVNQGVDFLAESAALVQAFELLPGGDEHAKQFENPQQAQKPQRPQVHRNEGLQVKRRNGQQVNDAKGAAHEAQSR